MNPAGFRSPATPLFLSGNAGNLFAIHRPGTRVAPSQLRRGVVIVPPFAEEMNKSRRMMSLQAEQLAAAGCDALIIDLFGTGDSAGEFADARWDIWCADIASAIEWLRAQGIEVITLLALRFGALLAMATAIDRNQSVERVVLWQPVVSGEAMMTQFLRLRLAADMASATGEKSSTATLRDALRRGEMIESAGYTLAPALVEAIDGLRLEQLVRPGGSPVCWIEIMSEANSAPLPASRRVIDAWQKANVDVRYESVAGAPFWSTAEIATVPELLDVTTRTLQAGWPV